MMTRHFILIGLLLVVCMTVLVTPFPASAVDMPAVKQSPVKWEAISGLYPIADMRFIAPHRLLVMNQTSAPGIEVARTPSLVDSSTGEKLWHYLPDGWHGTDFDLVAAFSDLVLIQENDSRDRLTTLAAMSGETGEQLWFVQYENKKRSFHSTIRTYVPGLTDS